MNDKFSKKPLGLIKDELYLIDSTIAITPYLKKYGMIKNSNSSVKVRGALMGDSLLTTEEVNYMASLPDRPTLLSRLLGQLQAHITGLATVLNAPTQGLATLLDRHNKNQEN